MKALIGSLAVAASLALAGQAHAAISVMGGGFAEACADAAKSGATTAKAEAICTAALDGEAMIPRDRAGTFVNRGIIKLRSKEYAGAIQDFNIAIRYKSDLAEAYVNRGAARIGTRHYAESIADLTQALDLTVQEPEKAYYNRAVAYEWMDNEKAAYFDYEKAIQLAPDWQLPKEQLTRFTVSHVDFKAPTPKP